MSSAATRAALADLGEDAVFVAPQLVPAPAVAAHDEVGIAVVVDVARRDAVRGLAVLPGEELREIAERLGAQHLGGVAHIRERAVAAALVQVAAAAFCAVVERAHEDVDEAVAIVVVERGRRRRVDLRRRRRPRREREVAHAVVEQDLAAVLRGGRRVGVRVDVGATEDVEVAVVVDVGEHREVGETTGGRPVTRVEEAAADGGVLELAVATIQEETLHGRGGAVTLAEDAVHDEIGEAVSVDIARDDADVAANVPEPRIGGDVREPRAGRKRLGRAARGGRQDVSGRLRRHRRHRRLRRRFRVVRIPRRAASRNERKTEDRRDAGAFHDAALRAATAARTSHLMGEQRTRSVGTDRTHSQPRSAVRSRAWVA